MRRKKVEAETTPPSAQGRTTPTDVQQVQFRLAFRGYNERDVDAFLDAHRGSRGVQEENERLRPATVATGSVGRGDDASGAETSSSRAGGAGIVRAAEAQAGAVRRRRRPGDPRPRSRRS
jgi:DivIVA domain-containing protein